MKLYLMRHGDYLGGTLEEALSPEGKQDVEQLAHLLKRANLHVGKIWHSGKLRAQQTAQIVAQGFSPTVIPQARPGLKPNDDVLRFADDLSLVNEDVVVVSHLPFLPKLVGKLLVQNENKELINFQAGTMACLEQAEDDRWLIEWVWSRDLSENFH